MPEMNGLEATTRVVKEFPNVRVIIISMHTAEEYVWQALPPYAVKPAFVVRLREL